MGARAFFGAAGRAERLSLGKGSLIASLRDAGSSRLLFAGHEWPAYHHGIATRSEDVRCSLYFGDLYYPTLRNHNCCPR